MESPTLNPIQCSRPSALTRDWLACKARRDAAGGTTMGNSGRHAGKLAYRGLCSSTLITLQAIRRTTAAGSQSNVDAKIDSDGPQNFNVPTTRLFRSQTMTHCKHDCNAQQLHGTCIARTSAQQCSISHLSFSLDEQHDASTAVNPATSPLQESPRMRPLPKLHARPNKEFLHTTLDMRPAVCMVPHGFTAAAAPLQKPFGSQARLGRVSGAAGRLF